MKNHNEEVHDFYVNVGKNIKYFRELKGITQEDLSISLAISRVSLVNIESGKQRLPLYLISSLSNILSIKIDSFVLPSEIVIKQNPDMEAIKRKMKISKLENMLKRLKSEI